MVGCPSGGATIAATTTGVVVDVGTTIAAVAMTIAAVATMTAGGTTMTIGVGGTMTIVTVGVIVSESATGGGRGDQASRMVRLPACRSCRGRLGCLSQA